MPDDNPIRRHFHKHSRYPHASLDIGGGHRIKLTITPSYAVIRTSPAGLTTYIPRDEFIRLIRWAVPLLKHMDSSFSVEEATRNYLIAEEHHRQALRQLRRHPGQRRGQSSRRPRD